MMWQYFAGLDRAATAWVLLHQTPAATAFMRFMTFVGSPGMMVLLGVVAVAFMLWQKQRRWAITVAVGLVGGALANETLKGLFHRMRPPEPWLTHASGYSFPSGHAMISMAFFLVLAVSLAATLKWRRRTLVGLALVVALLIGASRVYLGVHYASDVIAGWVCGALWAAACLLAGRRRGNV